MRGVTAEAVFLIIGNTISTHTPHARRDIQTFNATQVGHISTHTPHARRDFHYNPLVGGTVKFQLTRLMRGVTLR